MCFVSVLPAYLAYWMQYRQRLAQQWGGCCQFPAVQEVLLSLLSFCTACSIHGVQTREHGHTSRSPLDSLESAIGFHMRDWWQPTKANFFGHLQKPQIIDALNDAGLSGAARDAEKMKKGDAAEHAEFHMKDNRWVPGWMCTPRPQAETETTEYRDDQAEAA